MLVAKLGVAMMDKLDYKLEVNLVPGMSEVLVEALVYSLLVV